MINVTLGSIYEERGHLFVTYQGYVHMHFYVSEDVVADYIARRLPANVRPHKKIYDVSIAKRVDLKRACLVLLKYPLADTRKQELRLALGYSRETDRAKRRGLAYQLKVLLHAEKLEPVIIVEDDVTVVASLSTSDPH
jgi:hypothetical protein